jgi:hypothetical protein
MIHGPYDVKFFNGLLIGVIKFI